MCLGSGAEELETGERKAIKSWEGGGAVLFFYSSFTYPTITTNNISCYGVELFLGFLVLSFLSCVFSSFGSYVAHLICCLVFSYMCLLSSPSLAKIEEWDSTDSFLQVDGL